MEKSTQECLDNSIFRIKEGISVASKFNAYQIQKVSHYRKFSQIAECRNERTGEILAIKFVKKKFHSQNRREVRILKQLKSLNLPKCYVVNFSDFIKLNDSFTYRGFLYQEFELLDQTLFDYLKKRGDTLKVAELRAIAQQILVALSALKQLGITHTDLKLDNIMLVNHEEQPIKVKLIDFGFACETETLKEKGILHNLAYRAPEITLGLPRDEAIDTWSLGCLLSVLIIMKLLGQPDKKQLDEGTLVSNYFRKVKNGSECSWRFKTLKQYEKKKGAVSRRAHATYDDLTTLDDLFFSQNTNNSTENEDIEAFLDLVKKMLTVDPANRILPDDALKHPFITTEHLDVASDRRYVKKTYLQTHLP
uniref:Protein kinase domain-containing protein n=1 Tax=Nothobranchius furzeri TaxID=105023 RepID=A0A8C6MAV8_NOTFU